MAYCGQCGTKIEEGTKFCPSCGSKINEIKNQGNHTNHPQNVSNLGRLVVSTKIGKKMKSMLTVCCIVEILIGICMIFSISILQEALDSTLGGLLLGLIPGCLWLCSPFSVILGHKSYCDVHENGVSGMTALNLNNPNAPMQKFSIAYDEIINVTESTKTLIIYTQYAVYEVLAREHRKEALEEIRNRMLSNSK